MKPISLRGLAVACLLAALSGCSALSAVNSLAGGSSEEEAKTAMAWSFGAKAISIDLEADRLLNQYDGEGHTVVLAVVQMQDPNAFLQLLGDQAAVARLLSTGDGAKAMLGFERHFVEPGARRQLKLDRAQNAQYVGVVAGYYDLDPQHVARMFRVGVKVESEGLVVKKRSATPAPLAVRLRLGPERILDAAERVGKDAPRAETPAALGAPESKGLEVKITPDDIVNAQRAHQAVRTFQK